MGSVLEKLGLQHKARVKNRKERRRDDKWERGFEQRKVRAEMEFKATKRAHANMKRMLRKGEQAHERAEKRKAEKKAFEATLKRY